MTNLMCRGRKRGLAGTIAMQRLAKLAKNVAAETANFLMDRTFLDIDMARAADLLGMERLQAEDFRNLEHGHFIALGSAITVKIDPVETAARSGGFKLMPLPEKPPEDARDLIFTRGADESEEYHRPVALRQRLPPICLPNSPKRASVPTSRWKRQVLLWTSMNAKSGSTPYCRKS